MADLINLFIDDVAVSVPKGTLIVDAAKRASIDIPVFCYHPKLKPVGMCRMCLVQVGRVKIDRFRSGHRGQFNRRKRKNQCKQIEKHMGSVGKKCQ